MQQQELVERARAGDHDAFSVLVRASFPRLYAIATLILRDPDRAQDAVQEALVLAWRHVRALRDPDAWDAWLYRTTVRACYRRGAPAEAPDLVELHVMPDLEHARRLRPRPLRGGARPARTRARSPAHRPAGGDGPPLLPRPAPHGGGRDPRHPGRDREVPSPPGPARPARRDERRARGDRPWSRRARYEHDTRLHRDIADALDAEVVGTMPADLEHHILATTSRMRPLPRWLALLKEPPMRFHHRVAVGSPTVRLVAIMALTIALGLATAGAVAVGASHLPGPPKPPPFGTAANGSMYYSQDGDVYRAEPDGSNPSVVVGGPTTDRFPGPSRDGTRMLFLRGEEPGPLNAMLADADGTDIRDLGPVSDWFDWSPDDSLLAYCCDRGTIGTMTLEGVRSPLDLGGLEPMYLVNWRPTEGRELIFLAHPDTETAAVGLYAIQPDGAGLRQIGALDTDDTVRADEQVAFGELQLSTDGRTASYWNWQPDPAGQMGPVMHLRDLDTGEELPVPFTPPDGRGVIWHLSPDGEWAVFEHSSVSTPGRDSLFHAPIDGSAPAREIGPAYDYTWRRGVSFLPDGQKVLLALDPANAQPSVIIDVGTGETTELADITDGRTWQRLAP